MPPKRRLIRYALWLIFTVALSVTTAKRQKVKRLAAADIGRFSLSADLNQSLGVVVSTEVASPSSVKPLTGNDPKEREELLAYVYHAGASQKGIEEHHEDSLGMLQKKLVDDDQRLQTLSDSVAADQEAIAQGKIKEADLESRLTAKDEKKKQDVKRLIKLFSLMPPAKLIPLIEQMDDDVLTMLLPEMKDADVARIMAAIPAKRAAALTLKITDLKSGRS